MSDMSAKQATGTGSAPDSDTDIDTDADADTGTDIGSGSGHRSRQRRRSRAGPEGADAARRAAASETRRRARLYDEVTARIVAELEAGRVPWVQPWDAAAFAPGLPRNADSGRSYSGINILILWGEAAARGFAAQRWLTFRQALGAGGAVRRGEKARRSIYVARFTPKGGEGDDRAGAGHAAAGPRAAKNGDVGGDIARRCGGGDARSVPFLKRFTVFNVDQCEGLPPRCLLDRHAAARRAKPCPVADGAACGERRRYPHRRPLGPIIRPSRIISRYRRNRHSAAQIDSYRTAPSRG